METCGVPQRGCTRRKHAAAGCHAGGEGQRETDVPNAELPTALAITARRSAAVAQGAQCQTRPIASLRQPVQLADFLGRKSTQEGHVVALVEDRAKPDAIHPARAECVRVAISAPSWPPSPRPTAVSRCWTRSDRVPVHLAARGWGGGAAFGATSAASTTRVAPSSQHAPAPIFWVHLPISTRAGGAERIQMATSRGQQTDGCRPGGRFGPSA